MDLLLKEECFAFRVSLEKFTYGEERLSQLCMLLAEELGQGEGDGVNGLAALLASLALM